MQRGMRNASRIAGVGAGAGLAFAVPAAAQADTFTVTNLNNDGADSLRAAINAVNGAPSEEADIRFASGLTGTIELASALPTLTEDVSIYRLGFNGATDDASSLVIDGNDNFRIFDITADLSVAGFTIKDGEAAGAGGGIRATAGAGLAAKYMEFDSNEATTTGGAVSISGGGSYNDISRSTFVGNSAGAQGGAIYGGPDSFTFVTQSTFATNSSGNAGGAAAVKAGATEDLESGLNMLQTTISGNTASLGSGSVVTVGDYAEAFLGSTISAGNTPAKYTSNVYAANSLFAPNAGVPSGPNNIKGDPRLGALQDNGGPTRTMKPAFDGAGIDKGAFGFGVPLDQRLSPRFVDIATVANGPTNDSEDQGIDIGAVELTGAEAQGPVVPTPPAKFNLKAALKKCNKIKKKKAKKKCKKKARKRAKAAR